MSKKAHKPEIMVPGGYHRVGVYKKVVKATIWIVAELNTLPRKVTKLKRESEPRNRSLSMTQSGCMGIQRPGGGI